MSYLGRNGLVGLGIGVTVSTGLIAVLIIKEIVRRRRERHLVVSRGSAAVDGRIHKGHDGGVSVLSVLTPAQHAEMKKTLDEVMMSVSMLRGEVAELKDGLRDIANTIVEDIRKGVEEGQRSRRRHHFLSRERSDSMSSSSVYFTASNGMTSQSEGGYTTAYSTAESDYTDRETDRDEDRDEDDEEDVDEEEEERSCATVLTLQPDELQSEDDDVDADEEATSMMMKLSPELVLLLNQSDLLQAGDSEKKTDSFNLLMENKLMYSDNVEFLWRLARAYNDMCENAADEEERRSYAEQGRNEAELALQRSGLSADCHKWFALVTSRTSQCDSMHSKLKSSHILKEHLDRALALRNDDPVCFYLLGRWCYEVSRLSWLEQKAAAALYQTPPCSSVQHALWNFLKAEELKPGFSRAVRLYIAKCHRDLGNQSEVRKWVHLALVTPTQQEEELSRLEVEFQVLTDSPAEL